jgi:hypothetical protein
VSLKMLNKGKQALAYRQPSFGTFSTNLNPIYSFGVPRQVEMSGIMVDMDAVTQSLWTKDNDVKMVKPLVQQIGMMTSALEHRIPEMLFTNAENPGEAVSAVKALAIASAEGQRIYQITQENVNAVLPQLTISTEVKDEIRASVAVGKVATVSQNNITVSGWTGVGYIIADAETGAGAYRISGGSNGGMFMPTAGDVLTAGIASELIAILGFVGALMNPFSFPMLLAFALVLGMLFIFISVLFMDFEDTDWNTFNNRLAIIVGIFLGPFTFLDPLVAAGIFIFDSIMALILAFLPQWIPWPNNN